MVSGGWEGINILDVITVFHIDTPFVRFKGINCFDVVDHDEYCARKDKEK